MTMLAYITDECKEDATTHGRLAELERLAYKVEIEQTTKLFDHFPADFIVKKKFGNYNNRVIGKHVSVKMPTGDEIDVAVMLRVLIRGSHDYIAFSHNPIEYGTSHLEPLIDHEKLKLWVAERVATTPAEPLPQISDKEYGFLYSALVQKEGSSFVAESHSWFASVTREENREYLYTIGKEILSLAEQKKPGVHVVATGSLKVLARYFLNSDILVLIYLGENIPETHEILELSDEATSDEIDKSCRRKYPDYILADLSLWMNIQKDKAGNLALSPEESSVLNSVHKMNNPTPFPLFINGRAGSGKSTIIQYIFCDLLRYWFKELPTENPPIYLTYNKSLLDAARVTIESLLMHDAGSQGSFNAEWIGEHREQLDCSLREFHEFLYSHLEPHEHVRFPRSARMTFSRFKEEWEIGQAKNPASAELGPDLCWHILRTFIKGFESDLDSHLEPEDYENLEGGIKASINSEIYKTVYETIFKNWYEGLCSHEENSAYWDDQDLVRFLLDRDRLKPLHPAIVCDEAQDFTRVELHAILTLNLFSARSLNRQHVPMIPLIFAGDQFQTLNPTGFRWASIKSWFVENFIRKIDPTSKRNDLNYQVLCYNYRSTSEIVKFSNLVQYQRGELFNTLNEIEPKFLNYRVEKLLSFFITLGAVTAICTLSVYSSKKAARNSKSAAPLWPVSLFSSIIVLMVFAESAYYGVNYNSFIDKQNIYPESPVIEYIRSQPGKYRVVGWKGALIAGAEQVYGYDSITGYDPMKIYAYEKILTSINGSYSPVFTCEIQSVDSDWLNFLNVRYIVTRADNQDQTLKSERFSLVYDGSDGKVYENRACYPRAFRVTDLNMVKQLCNREVKERDLIQSIEITESDLIDLNSSAPQIIKYEANEIIIHNKTTIDNGSYIDTPHTNNSQSLIVLSEVWFPGWKVSVDGKPGKIEKIASTFMGVVVSGEEKEIKFLFQPDSFKNGLWISLSSLIFIISLGCLISLHKIRQNRYRKELMSRRSEPLSRRAEQL